jgi:hypothetical protein
VTHEDKLAAVERCIEDFRWARAADPSTLEHQTYHALKEVAADLRAAKPGTPGQTLATLEREVGATLRARSPLGHVPKGNLVAVGQIVVGRWREIALALREAAERQQATEEETLG